MRGSILYKFEELPIYREGDFAAGLIDGTAEIEFFGYPVWGDGSRRHHEFDWSISEIRVISFNGLFGDAAKSTTLELPPSHPLFQAIQSELLDRRGDDIAEAINEAIAWEAA